eukprot:maker-scaffold322_size207131-snap-gene-0.10 protein:Tk09469 transcript:maker-scaffold322_size207131-snap-gene-0.10-mRNA-1 annotation:"flavin reductase -like"
MDLYSVALRVPFTQIGGSLMLFEQTTPSIIAFAGCLDFGMYLIEGSAAAGDSARKHPLPVPGPFKKLTNFLALSSRLCSHLLGQGLDGRRDQQLEPQIDLQAPPHRALGRVKVWGKCSNGSPWIFRDPLPHSLLQGFRADRFGTASVFPFFKPSSLVMKIAVLGATGQTGICVVNQALKKGHVVKAIVRNPDKLKVSHANLEVVEGNVFSAENLGKHFQDCDVTISTLGFSAFSKPVTGYSAATKAMVEAMKSCGKKRLILMHSWYTKPDTRNNNGFIVSWIVIPMISPCLNDMFKAEEYLATAECTDIDFTVVLPAGLSNNDMSEKQFYAKEDDYRCEGKGQRIARADVARYLIKSAEEDLHKRKTVAIAVL